MDIALISPTSILKNFCLTSKVQMCLAHRILSEDSEYIEFYRKQSDNGATVILDNSLWELGDAMTIDKLIEAAKLVKPTELIVPDVFRDGPATLKRFNNFTFQAMAAGFDGPCSEEYPWQKNFVVVHGKDRQEWLECFDALNENHLAHTIGLPKVLDDIWNPGGRIGCVSFLEATGRVSPEKRYHCLGIWDDPIEVLCLSRHKWIRSLDTALPIHAGMHGIRFDGMLGLSRRRPRRPHIYFDVSAEDLEPRLMDIQHNVLLLQEWANGRTDR